MSQYEMERISIHDMKRNLGDEDMLRLEDTIRFSCKGCGKCCKNREDINLTGYDIYRVAEYLGRTHEEFITQYGTVFQSRTKVPSVALTMRAGMCPFLRNKKCAVHRAKPGVCRCYPLGRIYLPGDASARFIQMKPGCKHPPQDIAVRDWIGDFSTEEADRIGLLWSNTYSCVAYTLQTSGAYADAPVESKELILNMIFTDMFINYDTGKPFHPQLEANAARLRETLREVFSIELISVDALQKELEKETPASGSRYTLKGGGR